MRTLCTVVTVRFWADYPDDDAKSDAALDDYCAAIEMNLAQLPGVADGTVAIDDADTTDD